MSSELSKRLRAYVVEAMEPAADRLDALEVEMARLTAERTEIVAAVDELTLGANEDGAVLPERIRREFADFQMVIHHCSVVYDHMTEGRISKPNTLPSVVLAIADDLETARRDEAIKEAVDETRVLARQLAAALKQVEWALPFDACPWCYGVSPENWALFETLPAHSELMKLGYQKGHAPSCTYQAALAAAQAAGIGGTP